MPHETLEPAPVPRGRNAGAARTDLYLLCFANLPEHRKLLNSNVYEGQPNALDVEKIAKEIGISKQKVWSWMQHNKLPGKRIAALVNLKGSLLTFDLLGPYINTR